MLRFSHQKFYFFKKRFLKRSIKKQLIKITKFYKNLVLKSQTYVIDPILFYTSCFFLAIPKRQQYYIIWYLRYNKQKLFSAGRVLASYGRNAKFYKRSPDNIGGIAMQIKKEHGHQLKIMYLFKIKNLNLRQYSFFCKLDENLNFNVKYLVHKQSYIPRWLPTRRIKRVVLRMLNKV